MRLRPRALAPCLALLLGLTVSGAPEAVAAAEPGAQLRAPGAVRPGGDEAAVRPGGEEAEAKPRFEVSLRKEPGSVQPGGTAKIELSVRNVGTVEAPDGVGVTVEAGDGVTLDPLRSNCGRADGVPSVAHCRFDRAPDPGETATLDAPLLLDVPEHLLHVWVEAKAWPRGAGLDDKQEAYRKRSERYGTWRTAKDGAPAAKLEPGSPPDGSEFARSREVWFTVDTRLDVSVIGRTITGRQGGTVDFPIGIRERWPDGSDESPNHVSYTYRFTAPEGTAVVGVPEDSGTPMCKRKGSRTVLCPDNLHGERIRLRIDAAAAGAKGRAEIVHSGKRSARDPDRGNDRVDLALRVDGATTAFRIRSLTTAVGPWLLGAAAVVAAAAAVYRRRGAA
ncbi:hypothetical protein [Streptomyces sp. YIM 130001]|uniref:hypothetical protein n=1 Tax=Streptomyces sp. YIM 130001 TaxID=2259644 RepID=UPI000E65D1DA|nr:hypothetical protein [Streptomyces sp. YIM 130001]